MTGDAHLKVKLFDQLQVIYVTYEGENIVSSLRPRARSLLVYLLLQRHAPLTRKRLAFSLWPDSAEEVALASLRRALSELNTALPAPGTTPWISQDDGALLWNPDAPYWLDVDVYAELVQQEMPAALREAVALYAGDLLTDWDDEWILPERTRLRQTQFDSLRQLVAHHRAVGEVDTALEFAAQALELDSLSETAWRDLMVLHMESGDRAAALATYERLSTVLEEELGVPPMPETEALRQEIMSSVSSPAAEPASSLSPKRARPRLFGRAPEQEQLRRLWREAAAGSGGMAVVSGEAGIGKSLLVHTLADEAAAQGVLVLVGRCYEFEQALPFQAIVEMLRSAMNQLRHAALAPPHRAALAHLVPDLLGARESRPTPDDSHSDQLRLHLFEALLHTFQVLARAQPLLLICEDVHWAAASTLDWLIYIASRLDSSRILVIITYRTHEIDDQHLLLRIEQRLAREGRVTRVSLQPLSRQANRELVAHLSGLSESHASQLADRLLAETGGNPFFLHELVRGLLESEQITVHAGQWTGALAQVAVDRQIRLPDSLRQTIAARVARLGEQARLFIQTAAVAGRVFHYDIVRHAGEWQDEQALAALDSLLARGFLFMDEQEGHLAFSHHLAQEAIYAALSPPRRIYVHRQVAQAIRTIRPDDVETLVHHLIAAGERAEALDYAVQAAARAETVYAYEEAVGYRLMALDLLGKQKQPERRLLLLEELADDYRLLRNADQAISTYQAALELWQDEPSAGMYTGLRLYRKILQTIRDMWGNAAFDQVESTIPVSRSLRTQLADLLQRMETEPVHVEMARLFQALAYDAIITRYPPEWQEALHYARKSVTAAERLERPVELATALNTLSNIYGARGLLRERMETAVRARDICRQPGFDDPLEQVRITLEAGSALLHSGRHRRAIATLQEAWEQASRLRNVYEEYRALMLLHQCWFWLDRWDKMAEIEERIRSLKQAYSRERTGTSCFSLALSAAVYALRGEQQQAEQLRRESYTMMAEIGGPPERWRSAHHY